MQLYIKLDTDIAEWYESLPPRGKSEAINAMLRAGLKAQMQEESAIMRELQEIKQMIASQKFIVADVEPPQEADFLLSSLESIAVIDD